MGCDSITFADSGLALVIGSWRDGMHMINSKHLIMMELVYVHLNHMPIFYTICDDRQVAVPSSPTALPEQVTCWLSQVWA